MSAVCVVICWGVFLVLLIIGLLDFSVLVLIISHDPDSFHFSLLHFALFIYLLFWPSMVFGYTIKPIVVVF